MSKRVSLLALVLFATLPLHAAGFRDVVRAVEARTQMHPTYIPLLGLARFAVWIVHPEGVYDFQLATFEGHGADVEFDDLSSALRKAVGSGFRPLVQVRSKLKGEFTFIFARPVDEDRIEFMLATHDHSDTVVLRAVIDADRMLAHINEPHSFARLGTK